MILNVSSFCYVLHVICPTILQTNLKSELIFSMTSLKHISQKLGRQKHLELVL